MYQSVGKALSEGSKSAEYGDAYMDSLADYIQERFPGIKGFTRRGLYRMKQFYETYADDEKVSPLVTQLGYVINTTKQAVEMPPVLIEKANSTFKGCYYCVVFINKIKF